MKLLVSVVSAEEARRAVAGGADIVDVKDPGEGALGAPAPRVLSDVVSAVGPAAPVSVALGDMPNLPHTAALAARGAALSGAAYVKVGLRGVRSLRDAVALMGAVGDAVGPGVGVIAAAYADFDSLDPPAFAPVLLPELVRATGIAGGLVDTFVKDGRGLYGWLSLAEVADLVARTRAAGGTFGVAGQLSLGELCRVDADVVGVRSAVCRDGDRASRLEAELVAAAVGELRDWRSAYVFVSWIAKPRSLAGGNACAGPARRTHDHADAGPAHGGWEVRVDAPAAAPGLQLRQLVRRERGQRRVALLGGPAAEHAGDRFEQDRLVGPDRGGRQHRQRVAGDRPGGRHVRAMRKRPRHAQDGQPLVGRDEVGGRRCVRDERGQQHAELIHRLHGQDVGDFIGQAHPCVKRADRVGERPAAGDD